MIIEIDENWRIESDALQWKVQRLEGAEKNRQTGKMQPRWASKGYHRTLPDAIDDYYQIRLRLSGVKGPIPIALEEIRQIHYDMSALADSIRESMAI